MQHPSTFICFPRLMHDAAFPKMAIFFGLILANMNTFERLSIFVDMINLYNSYHL